MLTLGTQRVAGGTRLVARQIGKDGVIDATAVLADLGALHALDDLLDLEDARLADAIARLRVVEPQPEDGAPTHAPPLLRPARVRDCGLISVHLKPAFEVMIERIGERALKGGDEAQAALRDSIARGFGGPLRWGERDPATVSGTRDTIANPGGELDVELELAAVVRRSPTGRASLFGYTLYNDWTLRDRQVENFVARRELHADAKNFPGANSFGPTVTLAEDFGDPATAWLSLSVDDELITRGRFADIQWTFAQALGELYRDAPPVGHELIGSGTLLNGSLFEQRRLLSAGATVRLECDRIGVLANTVGGRHDL